MKLVFVVLVAVVIFTSIALAEEHSGDVWGTWTKANSPHIITGDVRVPPGQTLVIEPGCQVLFRGYYKFVVDYSATLLAVGTPTDWILFDEETLGTFWHGIRFLRVDSASTLSYCWLQHGKAEGEREDAGGAIYCYSSSPTISNCIFASNSAVIGGAIFCSGSNPRIVECIFRENAASYSGGAIHCSFSDPIMNSNTFTRNSAVYYGGAVYLVCSNPTISGNNFNFNASRDGGAIYLFISLPTVCSSTFYSNSADSGAIYCYYSSPKIWNSILRDMAAGNEIYVDAGSSPKVTYSNVYGGFEGEGNIDADPQFVNPEEGNLALFWGSPCIDTGDPSSPLDPDNTRADIGAFYFDQSVTPSIRPVPKLLF